MTKLACGILNALGIEAIVALVLWRLFA